MDRNDLFEDTLRKEAKQTVEQLRHQGLKKTIMLTGDQAFVARKIAAEAGIETVLADCLPAKNCRYKRNRTS